MADDLPIDAVLPALKDALAERPCVVLEAPPGAGKTTRVPLALLNAPWLAGRRIVMLEPRRLAARAAARFMAATLGEDVGGVVGYSVRFESRTSSRTRIEVVTEGVLTRRIQADPELPAVGCLIFDEFHERSLDADLGLALALDAQSALRPDLHLLVMSATLDGASLASLLDDAPVVRAEGRHYPVETRWLTRPAQGRFEDDMAALVRRALGESAGSLLAFLPGEGEIRRVAERLSAVAPPDTDIVPLYGALATDAQDRAIRPAPAGRRKIVLATTIAETSLTIEGISGVVDGGMKRVPRFEPRSGMTGLATVRVSRAAAEQRRGRAGRLGPGICWRLWTEAEERALQPYDTPEMCEADLAPLALDLAAWGLSDPSALRWLDPPPAGAFSQARDLLTRLEALDAEGRLTATGRSMAALPLHPRLAHMVIAGAALGHGPTAAALAAVLSERDPLGRSGDADLRARLELLTRKQAEIARTKAIARQLRRRVGVADGAVEPAAAGLLTALAYPDRVAERRGPGRFRLSGGGGATLPESDPLAAADFLAVADLDARPGDARIFLAAPLTRTEIETAFADSTAEHEHVEWNARAEAVSARRQRRMGALVLADQPLDAPAPAAVIAAMLAGVRRLGLGALPWTKELSALRARVDFLRAERPDDGWPDLSDTALLAGLDDWLGPYLAGITRRSQLGGIDLVGALRALLPAGAGSRLDALAPGTLALPTGTRAPIDYAAEAGPTARMRLQEVFGLTETPRVAGGRVPVIFELLSPAHRPLAVTRDLAGFWRNVYPQVRAEMRGRYPKHHWPEDPLSAEPTRTTRRRG